MLSDEIKKVYINEQNLSRMKNQIIEVERKNLKTSQFTTQDLVKLLSEIIEKNVE